MTSPKALTSLAAFQADFSALLRIPLDSRSGTFAPNPALYAHDLCALSRAGSAGGGRERLGIYNRQYWFRLFSALQTEFPLTAHVVGFWSFNHLAAAFLTEVPPKHWDLGRAADGFLEFLEVHIRGDSLVGAPPSSLRLPGAAVLQSARIDEAWRCVWRAPASPVFRPHAKDALRLPHTRLQQSPAASIVKEDWPLLALRRSLSDEMGEEPVPLPEKHPESQSFALVRVPDGMLEVALETNEARLLELLSAGTLSSALEALGELESQAPSQDPSDLAASVQRWIARSVALGFWSGAADDFAHANGVTKGIFPPG